MSRIAPFGHFGMFIATGRKGTVYNGTNCMEMFKLVVELWLFEVGYCLRSGIPLLIVCVLITIVTCNHKMSHIAPFGHFGMFIAT